MRGCSRQEPPMNPGELKLDLFCRGVKVDPSCDLARDGRPISRTRAGLGSGLEMILPDDLYVNVPVEEHFVRGTPYLLDREDGAYVLKKSGVSLCPVQLPRRPRFYDRRTSSGKLMSQVGVLQGTYLAIYPTEVCHYWLGKTRQNCKFCSTGLNIGTREARKKSVQDVVETVKAARADEGITFVHFNTGFYEGRALDVLEPYVAAVKREIGLLVGVQTPPCPDLKKYDRLADMGVENVSFCFELWDTERFKEVCPGKHGTIGQERYFETIAYCVGKFNTVNGEIIAGLEHPECSIEAINWMTGLGAVPTVCVFRPLVGTEYERELSPQVEDLRPVFRRLYEACVENNLKIGIAPNIKVSLVLLPEEGKYFLEGRSVRFRLKEAQLSAIRPLFRTYFWLKMLKYRVLPLRG